MKTSIELIKNIELRLKRLDELHYCRTQHEYDGTLIEKIVYYSLNSKCINNYPKIVIICLKVSINFKKLSEDLFVYHNNKPDKVKGTIDEFECDCKN